MDPEKNAGEIIKVKELFEKELQKLFENIRFSILLVKHA